MSMQANTSTDFRVKMLDTEKGFFVLRNFDGTEGARVKLNYLHFAQLIGAGGITNDAMDLIHVVNLEVARNTCIYYSNSVLVKSLIGKTLGDQCRALDGFVDIMLRSGQKRLSLTTSEWLMFVRACAYIVGMTEHSERAVKVGLDACATEILNSIEGASLSGGISLDIKENDVPFVQRVKTEKGYVWAYTVRNL